MTITKEDLLKEISFTELTQLSDLNAKGVLDEEVLQDAINDALSFIGSFFTLPDQPTELLKNIAIELTILELRRRNKLGQEERSERIEKIEAYLMKMAKKQIPVTTSQKPPKQSGFAFCHGKPKKITKGYL